jgi:hypothetical protein
MIFPGNRLPALTRDQWQARTRALQRKLEGLTIDELLAGERISRSPAMGGIRRSGYDPNQPRVPAGHPDGGQWTSDGRGGSSHGLDATVGLGGDWDGDYLDEMGLRPQLVASRVIADYSKAFTGISRIDKTTRALGMVLDRTMQTMNFIPTWTPQAYGTAVHVAFGTAVRFAGLEGIGPWDVEHSFRDGESADHGEPGSIRTDVVLRNEAGAVIAIYDVKTGGAKLTPARVRELRMKTRAGPNVPIIELHVVRGGRLTRRGGDGDALGMVIAQLGSRPSRDSWGRGAVS